MGVVWPAAVFGVVGAVSPPGALVFIGSAAAGVAVVSGAVVLQRCRLRPQAWLSVLAGTAVVAMFLRPGDVAVGEAVWLTPVAVVLVVVAAMSLRHLHRADLAAGASLAAAVRCRPPGSTRAAGRDPGRAPRTAARGGFARPGCGDPG
ncbi:hypothetical protein FXN61_32120 [Lentzea sp. PSKA42]|uniref:Uncharacterized protein n=1 Tax=Lentzea indica TaxID=2604800 RepID=A0ABX1FQH7_9PSEU|nr:hypothetical protein [Lentzea indica]NKE61170.1 hypothetical protein [Lentzea indica]